MQSENKMFDDFVKMVNGFAGTMAGMGREAESSAREKMPFDSRYVWKLVRSSGPTRQAVTWTSSWPIDPTDYISPYGWLVDVIRDCRALRRRQPLPAAAARSSVTEP